MEITNEQLEQIGQLSDTIDNLLGALKLPLRPEMHLQGLRGNLPEVRDGLREIYKAVSGDNPWEHHP